MTRENAAHAELRAWAEFDHVFGVGADGRLWDIKGVWAPDVMHVDGASHPNDVEGLGAAWETFSVGYTGQHGYNGAVMHASEYIGGRLADDILSQPGVYVVCAVECDPESRYPHEWSPSGARCVRCNLVGTGDPDDNPCELHPDYDGDADAWDYPEPAGWTVLRMRDTDGGA